MAVQRTKAPTIKDIAREAGVSKSAVSRALLGQGEVSEATRERVEKAADRLGYVANAMASGLRSSTKTIGVVLRDVTRPFYGVLFAGMQERAEQRGFRVVMATSAGELNVADALGALRALVSLQVDGLIIASAQLPSEQIVPFIDRVPMVVAGRRESNPAITSVYCDDVDGGQRLAEHVLALGHRRVAVALVDRSYSLSQNARSASMVESLRRGGAEVVVHEIANDGDTRGVVAKVLSDRTITALMCPTDPAMVDVLDELRIRGLSAPADLSVTGYDGFGPLAADYLGLTTFHQPVEEIGREAVDLLLESLAGREEPGRHVPLSGYLVEGRTASRPARTSTP